MKTCGGGRHPPSTAKGKAPRLPDRGSPADGGGANRPSRKRPGNTGSRDWIAMKAPKPKWGGKEERGGVSVMRYEPRGRGEMKSGVCS
jgi:hypothetical protein